MTRYDHIPYVKYGRTLRGLDCYGHVRLMRSEVFGRPLLPEWGGIDPSNKRELTKACVSTVQDYLTPCAAFSGAIAAAYSGKICQHIGIVVEIDGMTFVQHSDEPHGVERTPIEIFERSYSRVVYYD